VWLPLDEGLRCRRFDLRSRRVVGIVSASLVDVAAGGSIAGTSLVDIVWRFGGRRVGRRLVDVVDPQRVADVLLQRGS